MSGGKSLLAKYSISLSKIAKMHGLETVYTPKDLSEIMVTSPDVNRPGLQICGFFYKKTEKDAKITRSYCAKASKTHQKYPTDTVPKCSQTQYRLPP